MSITVPVKRQINMLVEVAVYDGLSRMARERGYPVSTFAKLLLDAAYSARCGQPTDRDLDATVAAALILQAGGMDTDAVARALRISEATAERIFAAWRECGGLAA